VPHQKALSTSWFNPLCDSPVDEMEVIPAGQAQHEVIPISFPEVHAT
jgi:hypothetical protein